MVSLVALYRPRSPAVGLRCGWSLNERLGVAAWAWWPGVQRCTQRTRLSLTATTQLQYTHSALVMTNTTRILSHLNICWFFSTVDVICYLLFTEADEGPVVRFVTVDEDDTETFDDRATSVNVASDRNFTVSSPDTSAPTNHKRRYVFTLGDARALDSGTEPVALALTTAWLPGTALPRRYREGEQRTHWEGRYMNLSVELNSIQWKHFWVWINHLLFI